MTLWVSSKGVYARRHQLESLFAQTVACFTSSSLLEAGDLFAGWGQKANTKQIKQKAQALGLPYWQLEDGFIGYIGHPARGGKAVSLIADPVGIYYDARQPSQLEQLIAIPCEPQMLARAERLIGELVRLGVTKYNCYATAPGQSIASGSVTALSAAVGDYGGLPSGLATRLQQSAKPRILLVDQVAGDLSIPGALASEADFVAMVEAARRNHPDARLLLRTHPDTRLGKKRGVLARLSLDDVEIVADHCHLRIPAKLNSHSGQREHPAP